MIRNCLSYSSHYPPASQEQDRSQIRSESIKSCDVWFDYKQVFNNIISPNKYKSHCKAWSCLQRTFFIFERTAL